MGTIGTGNNIRIAATIDDARTIPDVSRAVERLLHERDDYEPLPNPFYPHDARGIVFLRRRAWRPRMGGLQQA